MGAAFWFFGPSRAQCSMGGGLGPSSALLPWVGAPPCTPAYYFTMRGATPLCTPRGEGAPPLRPRVTFPSRGKSPKARQGLRPLESPGAWSPPFSRSLTHRAGLPSDTTKDRFATLRLGANRSIFLSGFCRRGIFAFQSVARECSSCGCRRCTVRGLPCFWA